MAGPLLWTGATFLRRYPLEWWDCWCRDLGFHLPSRSQQDCDPDPALLWKGSGFDAVHVSPNHYQYPPPHTSRARCSRTLSRLGNLQHACFHGECGTGIRRARNPLVSLSANTSQVVHIRKSNGVPQAQRRCNSFVNRPKARVLGADLAILDSPQHVH